MKITIIQGAFFPVPPLIGGAVEKLWYTLGRELAKRGHEIVHISRQWDQLPLKETIDGVTYIRIRGSDTSNNMLLFRLSDLIYSFRACNVVPLSDIVVTNTFFSPFLLSPKRHGKIYISVHRFPRSQHRWYRSAARFQCVSTAVANEIIKQCPSCASRTKIIPNFVENVIDFNTIENSWDKRSNSILFVGRIHPEKGLEVLIRAFSLLPSDILSLWKLIIVGPHETTNGGGGKEYLVSLQTLANQSKVKVEWVGPVFDSKKLSTLYAASKLFVYPSLASKGEALPLAPLEAMSQGTPVVVSGLDCFLDYVENGKNGWIFDHKSESPETSLRNVLFTSIRKVDQWNRETVLEVLKTASRFSLKSITDSIIEDFYQVAS